MMATRKSVRAFEKGEVIPDEVLKELLEASTTAPSGHNLQSWRVAVIRNPQTREAIKKIGHNQPQITDSAVLLVIYADCNAQDDMEKIYSQDVRDGFLPEEMLADKLISSIAYYASQSEEYITHTAIIDSSLFTMQLMLLAKERGYDSVPMRGFSQKELGTMIKQPAGYLPVMLISMGTASQPAFGTSRLPVEDFTQFYD